MSRITKKDCEITCDPTFLFPKEHYIKMCSKVDENYILVYMFDDLPGKWLSEIKNIADNESLKIVCIDKYITGSNIWLDSTMDNFFSFFNDARYIVTNTFHGTVFSIIFEKQFVCLDYNKSKVKELLSQFNLDGRLCSGEISDVLHRTIDYTEVRPIIMDLKEKSEKYLLNALDEITGTKEVAS